jgi:hypothetical protein
VQPSLRASLRIHEGLNAVAEAVPPKESEQPMPKIVAAHAVADVDKWLQFKSDRADAIAMLGGRNVVDHVAQDGSNTVAVGMEVDDVAGVMAALASPPPEMAAIMEQHGVIPPLTVYVEQ